VPYRLVVPTRGSAEVTIHVRNYRDREQTHRIEIHTPAGLEATPTVLEGKQAGPGITRHVVKISAQPKATAGLNLVALDITRDGVRHGELFDIIAWVGDPPDDAARVKEATEAVKGKSGY
jgi:hypothetical protein